MEAQIQIKHFEAHIFNFQAQFSLIGEGPEEKLHIRLVSENHNQMREGQFTITDIPENIKAFYEGEPILKTFFEDIYDNLETDALRITEEGEVLFCKKVEMGKTKIVLKKFILKTTPKQFTENQIILTMQKQIKILKAQVNKLKQSKQTNQQVNSLLKQMKNFKRQTEENTNQLRKQIMRLEKKLENDEIFSNIFSRMDRVENAMHQYKSQKQKLKASEYKFSSTIKGYLIVQNRPNTKVSSDGRVCEKIQNEGYRFVVIENSKGGKFHRISLRIKNLVHWMSFGLGLLDKIDLNGGGCGSKVSYSIAARQTQDSLNLYEWNKSNIYIYHDMLLITGDIVELEVENNVITFSKRGSSHKPIRLNIAFGQEQWANAVLFVNLYNKGDSVQIVE